MDSSDWIISTILHAAALFWDLGDQILYADMELGPLLDP